MKSQQLSVQENREIALKYAAPQIGTMNKEQISVWSKVLLLKVHVITGWVIPSDESLLTILVDQFEKKLIESYPNLNTEEIEYAFRNKGTTIKDWGKQMNLNLLDQVLIQYINERIELSERERRLNEKPPEQRIYTEEELLNFQREDIENFYQRLINGRGYLSQIPDYFRDVLIKDNLLAQISEIYAPLRQPVFETVKDFFTRKAGEGYLSIYKKIE